MNSKCILLGTLQETYDTLRLLERVGETPDHVICISPNEARRHRVTNYVDMRPVAAELGIGSSLVSSYAMKSPQDVDLFEALRPAVLLVVGWQRLLPNSILQAVSHGTIGFHGSCNILPWGRGRSPINWSILENRDRFALHMFFIKPGVDDGDIIGVRLYDINAWDNCRTVYYKTALAQAELLARYLPLVRKGQCPALQQCGPAFYYPKRKPEDGRIDWRADALSVCRLVRAVTRPYPGAFTELDGERLFIWECQPFSRDFFADSRPGSICFVAENETCEFVVRCGEGTVLATKSDLPRRLNVGDQLT